MTSEAFAPQQQRSRRTLARLLQAAVDMLEEHGLGGATIPRVAAAAGVAPASVYRRFRDKDALYRAAFLAVLERSAEANRARLRAAPVAQRTLEQVAGDLVGAVVRQYRTNPGLLRALVRFLETDTDVAFRKAAVGYVAGNIRDLGDVLLTYRDRITHPNPERAVIFALLNVATVVEVRMLEQASVWDAVLPISEGEMEAELTRAFLAYLTTR